MNRKQSTKKSSTKGKAEVGPRVLTPAEMRESDLQTAEQIRAILSSPNTSERVTLRLATLVSKLGEATETDTIETPNFYADSFAEIAEDVRADRTHGPEVLTTFAQVKLYAERHEPEAHKLARRSREIYVEWLGRKKGRRYADGAHFFVEHTDAVLEGGEGLNPNPDSKYFVPLFVEALNERGPRDRHVRRLLDLIKRVDEGADLNALHDEAAHASKEREQAHRPKDARLVDALSDVLSNPKRRGERDAILIAVNDLSNMTPVSDLHPDIFPTLARVLIREARAALKGKGLDAYKRRMLRVRLGELARIAGE